MQFWFLSTHGLSVCVRVKGVSEEVEATADEEEHNIIFSLSLYHSLSTQLFPCYQSTVNERVALACSQIAHVPLDGVAAVLCGELTDSVSGTLRQDWFVCRHDGRRSRSECQERDVLGRRPAGGSPLGEKSVEGEERQEGEKPASSRRQGSRAALFT